MAKRREERLRRIEDAVSEQLECHCVSFVDVYGDNPEQEDFTDKHGRCAQCGGVIVPGSIRVIEIMRPPRGV